MIANVRYPAVPLGFALLRGLASDAAACEPLVAVRLMARRLSAALAGGPRREAPPGSPANAGDIWDDPALWMLLIH